MKESFRTRLTRLAFNFWPCYFGTGGRITFISSDFRHVRVVLDLKIRTRNYFGTIFGGSMYGCIDPIYAVMLMKVLGPGFEAWDKAATIRFKRPGRTRLTAEFDLSDEELREIRLRLETQKFVERVYGVTLKDADGKVHAEIDKTIFITKKHQT